MSERSRLAAENRMLRAEVERLNIQVEGLNAECLRRAENERRLRLELEELRGQK